jgi:hypothetical protein
MRLVIGATRRASGSAMKRGHCIRSEPAGRATRSPAESVRLRPRATAFVATAVALTGWRASDGTSRGGFVTLLGRDTVALESFTRASARLEGDIIVRVPGTVHFHYLIERDADGTVARTAMDVHAPGLRAAEPRRVRMERQGDSLRVVTRSFARPTRTRADADFFRIAWTHLALDTAGRVLSADASETTEKTQSMRVEWIDVPRLARDFAARDRAGRGLGVASPNVVARASLDGASIVVTYGSPRLAHRGQRGDGAPHRSADRARRHAPRRRLVQPVDRAARDGRRPGDQRAAWAVGHGLQGRRRRRACADAGRDGRRAAGGDAHRHRRRGARAAHRVGHVRVARADRRSLNGSSPQRRRDGSSFTHPRE